MADLVADENWYVDVNEAMRRHSVLTDWGSDDQAAERDAIEARAISATQVAQALALESIAGSLLLLLDHVEKAEAS